jgi:hypothetical protein
MKKLVRYTFVLILGAVLSTATVFAQQQQMPPQPEPLSPEEVTDEQLEMVVNVSEAVQGLQKEADMQMREVIAEEEMEYSRFQQIMMAQQNPQMAGQVNVTEDEKKTLQKVQPKLQEITMKVQQGYMTAIQDEGLSPQKFQQIAQAIQAHPEVAKRFEEIKSESAQESGSNDGSDG